MAQLLRTLKVVEIEIKLEISSNIKCEIEKREDEGGEEGLRFQKTCIWGIQKCHCRRSW